MPADSYCLNPACHAPQNVRDARNCDACGEVLCLRDRYRALSLLGKGGFGATFLAVDAGLPGRPHCALKQLRPDTARTPADLDTARKLFAREAETLGALGSHPQLPRLLDYFEADGRFYLVQEYVEGQTLAQEVRQNGPFDEAGARKFLLDILPCIDYVHSHRVIHRDIKPQNIIRRRADGNLVLIDFGAVRHAMARLEVEAQGDGGPLTQSAVWTPGYSAPEQMALRPVFASDLYSLGVTCLFLLTGNSPQNLGYDPETGLLDWQQVVRVSPRFTEILYKMLEIAPRDRFSSAREILAALSPEATTLSQAPSPRVNGTAASAAAADLDEPTLASGLSDTAAVETQANLTEAASEPADLTEFGEAGRLALADKTRVLIVQDVQVLARSLYRKLQKLGYSIADVVSLPQVALDRAASRSPDIVLMELSLAGNPDVVAIAAEIYERCQIPTVYLASHEFDERLERARGNSAYYGHILRPYAEESLQATIESALSAHYRQLRERVNRESTYGQQLKLAEETLQYLVYHDRVTDLPNHLSLREQFSQALKRRQFNTAGGEVASPPGEVASPPVGCLGLGHPDSQVALQDVARHLKETIGPENGLAYLGDNCFAIVWASLQHQRAVIEAASGLLAQLESRGYRCNLGLACHWQNLLSIERLLTRARTALKVAGRQGVGQYVFYNTYFETACGPNSEQILLERELQFALDRDELQLHYQPRLDLRELRPIGVEALVRWFHPALGNVAPSRFLPVAEDLGLMAAIGEWICRAASSQIARWQQTYDLPLTLAVNLDSTQFADSNLDRNLAAILAESGFDPHQLELEVTESLLVSDPQRAQQQLRALRALGVKVAIDDFGTGYSSLSYLRQFPFDILKIDRCFVQNLHEDPKNGAIAVAIARMAASLNLRVVAEGVETLAELEFLRQYPCDEAQGYLFSPPLPAAHLETWLAGKSTVALH